MRSKIERAYLELDHQYFEKKLMALGEEIESLEFHFEKIKDDQSQLDTIIDTYFQRTQTLPSPLKLLFDYSTKLFELIEPF